MFTATVPHQIEALRLPVGASMRQAECLNPEDSLDRAARLLQDTGQGLLPVVQKEGLLVGAITEVEIGCALSAGASVFSSVEPFINQSPTEIYGFSTGAEALRALEGASGSLIVVDGRHRVVGIISASDLVAPAGMPLRPKVVGGMATPFGVYLTNGSLTGGASPLALVTTGMLLFTLFLCANAATMLFESVLGRLPVSPTVLDSLMSFLAVGLFLLGIRSLPLAGTHAAEHMVVHAIERGEPLVPEVVRRMPRVHPRCGTNFATAAILFLSISGSSIFRDPQLRLLLAALVTLFLWKPLGSILQYWVTTRKPNAKQLASGIRAGQELLSRYQYAPHGSASIGRRIWNSGLLQIFLGSAIIQLSLELIGWIFGWKDVLQVYF